MISNAADSGVSPRDKLFPDEVRQQTNQDSGFHLIDAIRFQWPWPNCPLDFEIVLQFSSSFQ
jgi:hypothetical protein